MGKTWRNNKSSFSTSSAVERRQALALNELQSDARDSVQSMMIHTLQLSYFTKKFGLYQKIRTLRKYFHFTENFILYQKIRAGIYLNLKKANFSLFTGALNPLVKIPLQRHWIGGALLLPFFC